MEYLLILMSTIALASALPILEDDIPMDLVKAGDSKIRLKRDALQGMLSVIGSIFARADGNADGVLNLVEYWGTYRAFDMDHNGEITMDEYVETISQMPALKSMGSEHEVDAVSRRLFLAGDMNDNNLLDEGDANIIFFNLDKDVDGEVSLDEYKLRWQEVMARIGMI